MTTRLLAALAPLLVLLPACGPPPALRLVPGGLAETNGHARFAVVQSGGVGGDDVAFIVSCPIDGNAVASGSCSWARAGNPRQAPIAASRLLAARAVAGADHGCALDEVTLRSDGSREGVEGYWLLVCRTQRFYQWSGQVGRFLEREAGE